MSVPMWRPVDIGDTGGAEEHAGYTCGRWTRVACRRRQRQRRMNWRRGGDGEALLQVGERGCRKRSQPSSATLLRVTVRVQTPSVLFWLGSPSGVYKRALTSGVLPAVAFQSLQICARFFRSRTPSCLHCKQIPVHSNALPKLAADPLMYHAYGLRASITPGAGLRHTSTAVSLRTLVICRLLQLHPSPAAATIQHH